MNNYKIDVKAKGMEKFAHQEIQDSQEMEALFKKIKKVLSNNSLDKSFKVYIEFFDRKGEERTQIVEGGMPEVVAPEEDEAFLFEDKGYY